MAFYPKSGKMYLSKLYVDSIYRGKGISSKMFQFIKQETMKEKLSAIILNVNRNNTEVIRIYEHLGFCKVREEENDIGNGYFMEDFVLEYTCNYE
jgi:ribosomal protein S18 acetylase RimI-like enzyme